MQRWNAILKIVLIDYCSSYEERETTVIKLIREVIKTRHSPQMDGIHRDVVEPIVDEVLLGYNCTLLACGQLLDIPAPQCLDYI